MQSVSMHCATRIGVRWLSVSARRGVRKMPLNLRGRKQDVPMDIVDVRKNVAKSSPLQPLLIQHENTSDSVPYPPTYFGLPRSEACKLPDAETILRGTNHLAKKDRQHRLAHTLRDQIAYMNSETYRQTYMGMPVHKWYRRNYPGTPIVWPAPRLRCVDELYRYIGNNPCPICRDEYLWFDFRNMALIEQFLITGTIQPMDIKETGLCQEQYELLQVELGKALDTGYLMHTVPHRHYDYAVYYGAKWKPPPELRGIPPPPETPERVKPVRPRPLKEYPTFNPENRDKFDMWWKDWDKIAKKFQ